MFHFHRNITAYSVFIFVNLKKKVCSSFFTEFYTVFVNCLFMPPRSKIRRLIVFVMSVILFDWLDSILIHDIGSISAIYRQLSFFNSVGNFNLATNFTTMCVRNECFLLHFSLGINIFSSPEPKAQVSFSDQNLSVVRRRCCRCCRCRCHKLFTFSSPSLEPLSQFQLNLAQSILGWREFKFVQMKAPVLFQGEIITK